MFRLFLSLIVVAMVFTAPVAQAQINTDIPETEGPGDGGDLGPDQEFYCMQCCSNGISDPGCCGACGCQCLELPNCAAYSTMSAAKVPDAVNAYVLNSFAKTRDNLITTKRGKALYSVLQKGGVRITKIFGKHPKLSARTGAALAKYWPHDMWTNTGDKAHKVTPEALQELRKILTQIAKADKAMGASEVSQTINKNVLPHLGKNLIGRPYHKAFGCFVSGKKCSSSN